MSGAEEPRIDSMDLLEEVLRQARRASIEVSFDRYMLANKPYSGKTLAASYNQAELDAAVFEPHDKYYSKDKRTWVL